MGGGGDLPAAARGLPAGHEGRAPAPRRRLGPVPRAPAFWFVALADTAGAVLFSIVAVHAIPMLQEAGLSAAAAVAVASFTGPMQVAGRVLEFAGAYVVLYGASGGILTIMRGTVPAELFGRAGYAAVAGALVSPGIVARAIGPYAAAWLWQEAGGDYRPGQIVMVVCGVVAALAFIGAARTAPAPVRNI